MRKLAIIDKNSKANFSQWQAAIEPKKFFHNDNNLVSDMKKYNPDIIFINKGNVFSNIPQAIKEFKSVYFYGDFYRPIPQYVIEYSKIVDAVIFTNKDKELWINIKNNANQKNIYFVSMGTDIEIFKPLENVEKKYDIIFPGNYFGKNFCGSDIRLNLVKHLKDINYNFQVIGDGWPKEINAISRQGHHDLNLSINQAKITVGMSHFIDIPYYTSNRLYQCMATGVPHITWYSPGVRSLFKKSYLDVNSYQQLDNMIYGLIKNKVKRNFFGLSQRYEIKNHHTIFDFWQQIENILQSI